MKKIRLGGKNGVNKFVFIDDSDFEWLNQWRWHLSSAGYAVRTNNNSMILMHRVINNTPLDYDTDHIDRNPLNNQRINLRTATHQENMINRSLQKNNTSGYAGVTWDKINNKWLAGIQNNGKFVNLGRYTRFEEALLARKQGERIFYKI